MYNEELAINKRRREPSESLNSDVAVKTTDVLKLKLRLKEIKSKAAEMKSLHPNDASLYAVIDLCMNSWPKVVRELEKLSTAMAKLEPRVNQDVKVKVRYDYLDYQKWFVEEHAKRAHREALRRKKHLATLTTPEKIAAERKKCEDDIEYWFKNYAWIVDPRNNVLFAFPFELFEFQRESLHWIDELIYIERTDALIDKSRDMGVTWLIVCMFVYYWLFPKNQTNFQGLITSYREDEVDKKGVPSTIFEKIRTQVRLLPGWMLPNGFKPEEHMTHMKCINPENGSTITGSAANAEVGRSGRYTCIFFDEMASIKDDVSSATSAGFSTNTRLFVSTPKGKLNYFAELRFNGDIQVQSFLWTKHPLKDARWYNGQKLKMSSEMIAQELDIDYDASQPGKVYPMYNEVYHVITWSDFCREVLGSTITENGITRHRIPVEWWLGRDHDWGSSDSNGEHANMTYWFGRAKEGTKTKTHGIDIGGAVFVYRELLMPPHSTVRAVAKRVHALQAPDNEQSRMQVELMSHEALSERDTYEQEHDLYYKNWDTTDFNAGIAQVRDYLEVQYTHQPHPFRKVEKDKPIVKGRPMLYFIVDDDQGECYFDQSTNKWQVRPAKDQGGLARIRAEIGVYHYPKSEAGKAVRKQRPEKLFDDAMDCLRCMAVTFPPVASYTIDELVEQKMPVGLRRIDAIKATPEDKAAIWLARQAKINEEHIRENIINSQKAMNRRSFIFRSAKQKADERNKQGRHPR